MSAATEIHLLRFITGLWEWTDTLISFLVRELRVAREVNVSAEQIWTLIDQKATELLSSIEFGLKFDIRPTFNPFQAWGGGGGGHKETKFLKGSKSQIHNDVYDVIFSLLKTAENSLY